MNKYNIEGDIDFYTELYKLLDIDEDTENKIDNREKCLISNEILTEHHVIMKCGHKFNYIPLYNDLLNHKQKFNFMEGSNRLQTNQIRCPYCRKKQTELLPYYEELGLKKVNGVNYFDPNIKSNSNSYMYNNSEKCKYQVKNLNFDETKLETEINKKYYTCNIGYASTINLYNSNNPSQPINYGDINCYCYAHKKIMIKQYKTLEKQKIKDEEKAAKQKAKDNAKAVKDLEKQKLKEEKQKMKDALKLLKNKKNENLVLGPSNVVITPNESIGCIQTLKTGPNKGKQCGCKISSENLCLRHFKIVNKLIINN
jgi:hypothetical protein